MCFYTPLLLRTKAVILVLFCLSNVHGITEYYVKPTERDNTSCPGEPCHTLNYFASNMHNKWSGAVVRFLPGNHSLNRSLYISSSSNLHLTSFDPVTSIQNLIVNIHCPSTANFHFYNVSNITVVGLCFYNCGRSEPPATLYFQHVTNFWVDYIEINGWPTTDVIQVNNGFGRSVISHSNLDCHISIQYQNAIDNSLIISKSSFKGSALDIRLTNLKNATLHIEISDNSFTSSRWNAIHLAAVRSTAMVHIRNCLLTGSMHGALYFQLTPSPWLVLTIESSVISSNIVTGEFEGAAGMTVHAYKTAVRHVQDPIIIMRNVSFLGNKKYGKEHSATMALYYTKNVTFTDCEFHGNRGTAIGAYQSTFYMNGYNSFINNTATVGGAIALLDNSYMMIQNNTEIRFLIIKALD